ncbi:hypothetical protein [Brachybacterium phenoliresistens]|uniref:Uncharacterized protein n=1 Tax=Brachybacterium phenoliresistens TaxID=396014 RepID=Z9JX78_9MICO|nr:hypothetical protein [Brachybacterium phenoliresistens]EWS82975.1 hypothetical protein BF93_06445 [Brachybacterium phenoliresistens]
MADSSIGPRRGTHLVIAGAVGALVCLLGAWIWLSGGSLTSSPRLADLVSDNPNLGTPLEVTDTYCAAEIGCVEAWSTDLGVYMEFDSRAEAEHWGTIFGGDGAQWERFVLDGRGKDLEGDRRIFAVQILLQYDGI